MRTALLLAQALLLLAILCASSFGAPTDPADYASRSGEYSLHVEPSQPRGGAGTYTLTRAGQEVWSLDLAYTLTEVAVADDGMFVGSVETTRERESVMIIVRVSAAGELLMEHTVVQTWHAIDGPSYPLPKGLFLQPELQRFVVLVAGPEQREAWWIFEYASADPPEVVYPDERLGLERSCTWRAGRAVPGTHLTLMHCFWSEYPQYHARFLLLDEDWGEVWRLDIPDDYTLLVMDELFKLWETEAILATGGNSFELRLYRDNQRLEFLVRLEPDAPTGWSVREVGRRPYVPPTPELPVLEIEDLELAHLGSVVLGEEPDPRAQVFRDVQAFSVAPGGELSFMRWEEEERTVTLVTLDSAGELVRTQPVAELLPEPNGWLRWSSLGAGQFLGWERGEDDEPTRAWTLDAATGRVTWLPYSTAGYGQVAGTPEGGCVALGRRNVLACYAANGTLLWRQQGLPRSHPEADARSVSFKDVAVTSEGLVAVLEFRAKQVLIFEADGTFRHAFDLADAIPQRLKYPSGLAADAHGGLLLYDSSGSLPIWRLSVNGTSRGPLDPRFPNGRSPIGLAQGLHCAADGHLWSTDGTAIVRHGEDGIVDRVLGPTPEEGGLQKPRVALVDSLGRILVADRRTAFVHVFDHSGAELMVCRPDPEDFEHPWFRMAVSGDGSVFLRPRTLSGNPTIEFSPTGTRVGTRDLGRGEIAFTPGSHAYWHAVDLSRALELVNAEGKIEARVERWPDRTWLGASCAFAVAAGGSLAVLEAGPSPFSRVTKSQLALYAKDGTPLSMFHLPSDVTDFSLSFNQQWIMLGASEGPGYLLRVADGSLHRIRFSDEHADTWGFTGFSPDGRELWWIGGTRLERFALPED